MRLFIAEKPELAKAIVAGIGGDFQRKDGYYVNGDEVVTWCYGHMLQLCDPEEYDAKYQKWNLDDLPFCFLPPKHKPNLKTDKQLKVIKALLKESDSAVNAGDPDDEGQLLVDEIFRYYDYKKPVYRVLINDNNTKVVAKAIANMEDNGKFEYLGYRALARSIADQYFGYNLSRLYTLLAQAYGGQDTLSVGRVQTPILGLVVRRDKQNAGHKVDHFYNVVGDFEFNNTSFSAKYLITDNDAVNDSGKLDDESLVKEIANRVNGKSADILSIKTSSKNEKAPLPFSIIKLQQAASNKWGYKPTEVDAITQNLREKHQLITYNRSDCQYLSDEQYESAPLVLDAIAATAEGMQAEIAQTDSTIKGRVFNSSKVSAHHAIVPTETVGNFKALSEAEKNIYLLIARAYIAQFYPDRAYDETKIVVGVGSDTFGLTSNIETAEGWKVLYRNEKENDNDDDEKDVSTDDLRQLTESLKGTCSKAEVTKHETKPPKLYTMTTLLGDLTRASKYVKDKNLAEVLKERDKDKAGESGGIGTPATRSSIVEGLFDRGFLVEKGKSIVSTDLAKVFYDQLHDIIVYPDMTAIWHEQQQDIEDIEDVYDFVRGVMEDVVNPEVERLKKEVFKIPTYDCDVCGRKLKRTKGKDDGFFWGCTGYQDENDLCKNMLEDDNGKPGAKSKSKTKRKKGFGFRL